MQDVAESNFPIRYLHQLWKSNTNKVLGRHGTRFDSTCMAKHSTPHTSRMKLVATSTDISLTPK